MSFYSHALFSTISSLSKLNIATYETMDDEKNTKNKEEFNEDCVKENIEKGNMADTGVINSFIPHIFFTNFHLKNYYDIYVQLSCQTTKSFYFCKCHTEKENFLRNYVLYLHNKTISSKSSERRSNINSNLNSNFNKSNINIKFSNISNDNVLVPYCNNEFIFYVSALLTNNTALKQEYLLKSIELNGLFIEAYQELTNIVENKDRLIAIGREKKGDEMLVWEVFKVEFYVFRYIDLGIEENLLFKIEENNEGSCDIDNFNLENLSESDNSYHIDISNNSVYDTLTDMNSGYNNNNFNSFEESVNESIDNTITNTINSTLDTRTNNHLNTPINISSINANSLSNNSVGLNTDAVGLNDNGVVSNNSSTSTFMNIYNTNLSFNSTGYTKNITKIPYLINLRAAYFYTKKNYDSSLALFKKTVLIDFYDLYSNILYIRADKRGLAILCHKLITTYPFRAETMASIGNFYSLQKNHHGAISYFKKAIRYNHKYLFLNTLIANEYMEINQPNTAIKYYTRMNNDYRAYFGMAQAYSKCSTELSISFFKKTLTLNEKDPFIWQSLGNEYKKINEIKKAKMCYKKMVELKSSIGWLLCGDMFKNRKEYENAVKYYKKYVEVVKDDKIQKFLKEYDEKIKMSKE